MKKVLLLCFILLNEIASGQSSTKTCGTGADDSGAGTISWSNTSNITGTSSFTTVQVAAISGDATNITSVKLIKGGTIQGNNKSDSYLLTTTLTSKTYGTTSDLWGLTLAPSDVNASNFGFEIAVVGTSGTSHYLDGTNFGFSIPSTATILGIQAIFSIKKAGTGNKTTNVQNFQITITYSAPSGVTSFFFSGN